MSRPNRSSQEAKSASDRVNDHPLPVSETSWTVPLNPLTVTLFILFELIACVMLSFLGSVSPPLPRSPWLSVIGGLNFLIIAALPFVIGPRKPRIKSRSYRVMAGIVCGVLLIDVALVVWLLFRLVTA